MLLLILDSSLYNQTLSTQVQGKIINSCLNFKVPLDVLETSHEVQSMTFDLSIGRRFRPYFCLWENYFTVYYDIDGFNYYLLLLI